MTVFGDLDRSEQLALFEAWVDGEVITRNGATCLIPDWSALHLYEVKSRKPSIDWAHVSDEFNYLAMDNPGDSCLYREKPKFIKFSWDDGRADYEDVAAFKSFKPGSCKPEDSLICRSDHD